MISVWNVYSTQLFKHYKTERQNARFVPLVHLHHCTPSMIIVSTLVAPNTLLMESNAQNDQQATKFMITHNCEKIVVRAALTLTALPGTIDLSALPALLLLVYSVKKVDELQAVLLTSPLKLIMVKR